MKVKAYTFKPGARLKTKIKPDALMKELDRVRNKTGALTPSALVNESRPVKAVLHPEFTWADDKAAELWRMEEARNLLRVTQVVYETGPVEPQRAVVLQTRSKDMEDVASEYAPVHEVLERQSTRDRLILDLLRDLQAFRRRFALVSELSHAVPVLDSLISTTEQSIAAEETRPKRRAR